MTLTREEIEQIRCCLDDGSYTPLERKDFAILCDMALRAQDRAAVIAWIPVTERLPERNATVLYWHKALPPGFGAGTDGWVAQADEWRDEQHLCFATHWMPLPAAPEGKETK